MEIFEKIDNDTIDNSIVKRTFIKVYHQQRAILNNLDQNIEFISEQNNKYQQIGNAYPQYDITIRKLDDTNFLEDASRKINNVLLLRLKKHNYQRREAQILNIFRWFLMEVKPLKIKFLKLTIFNLKIVLKNVILEMILGSKKNNENFITILYIVEVLKNIQTNDSYILIMVV